jgi:hypothetical protein
VQGGDAFLLSDAYKGVNNHFFVVLSDPTTDPQRVLIVNLTTLKHYKDQACIVNVGDHPWVSHASCVAYDEARFISVAQFDALKLSGKIVSQPPVSDALLTRIRKCVWDSRMNEAFADFLDKQGVLPPAED